ncbi:MAG: DUF5819 family protein [Bacteroidia bacterium]
MLIHFSCLLIYPKPISSQKNKAEFYAQAYIYPYFHQNWNLFAPVPNSNYNLYCEYENNGIQKTDLFAEIKTIHQTNRFKGYGPLVVAFANGIHYFEKNAKQQQPMNGPISSDLNFKIIQQAAKNYLEYSKKIQISKLKMILVVTETLTNKQKVYFN